MYFINIQQRPVDVGLILSIFLNQRLHLYVFRHLLQWSGVDLLALSLQLFLLNVYPLYICVFVLTGILIPHLYYVIIFGENSVLESWISAYRKKIVHGPIQLISCICVF